MQEVQTNVGSMLRIYSSFEEIGQTDFKYAAAYNRSKIQNLANWFKCSESR
jgi:hypothetical protein